MRKSQVPKVITGVKSFLGFANQLSGLGNLPRSRDAVGHIIFYQMNLHWGQFIGVALSESLNTSWNSFKTEFFIDSLTVAELQVVSCQQQAILDV